jgi:hypothetical protein
MNASPVGQAEPMKILPLRGVFGENRTAVDAQHGRAYLLNIVASVTKNRPFLTSKSKMYQLEHLLRLMFLLIPKIHCFLGIEARDCAESCFQSCSKCPGNL